VLSQQFDYCPSCGDFVSEHCEQCHRRMNPAWTFCPHCGEGARRATLHETPAPAFTNGRRHRAVKPDALRNAS
jgi:RNA polymerase subunit RPABC4/transcription elongation factor Spt4